MSEKDTRTIYERMIAVMDEVRFVEKSGVNEHQRFRFRGIDAVMNAVGPALRKHGVFIEPQVEKCTYTVEEFGSGKTRMGHVQVLVRYTFRGLLGDSVEMLSAGEATDSGDKATAKAMSVALRTIILQTFCLPTDERDPDEFTYERSPAAAPVAKSNPPKVVKAARKVPPSDEFMNLEQLLEGATIMTELDAIRERILKSAHETKVLSDQEIADLRVKYAEAAARLS